MRQDELPAVVALLHYCARIRVDAESATRIRALASGPLEWDNLPMLANWHLVTPLVHRILLAVAPEAVPPHVLERLGASAVSTAGASLLLTNELLGVLRRFAEREVPVVPFKGPTAAVMAYGEAHLRPCSDLDLLVHPHDFERAAVALESLAYRARRPLPRLVGGRHWSLVWRDPLGKDVGFVREPGHGRRMLVELHWGLAPRFFGSRMDPDDLWERLRPVVLLGEPVMTFSPEDTLLHFCLHGSIHRWERLRLVTDVTELVRSHPQLDWDWVLSQSSRLRSSRMLSVGLQLAHHLLAAPVPLEVRRELGKDSIARRIVTGISSTRLQARDVPRPIRSARNLLPSAHSELYAMGQLDVWARLPHIIHLLNLAISPSPRDRSFLTLPDWLFPLYFVVRPIRLASNAGAALARMLRQVRTGPSHSGGEAHARHGWVRFSFRRGTAPEGHHVACAEGRAQRVKP